jgi:hypothetical protein
MYALAASVTGVSVLVLAQQSEAKIVYTKTHQVIGWNGIYNLDLNHDGTVDFLIQEWGSVRSSASQNALLAKEAFGNAVEGGLFGSRTLAGALKRGALNRSPPGLHKRRL